MLRRSIETALHRAVLAAEDRLACGVCGSRAPRDAVDVHEVIPAGPGRTAGRPGLVVLCERHRAAARDRWLDVSPGSGPANGRELVLELRKDEALLQLLDAILSPSDPAVER